MDRNALNFFAWLSKHLPFACETVICDRTWEITLRETREKRQDGATPPKCKLSKTRESTHSFLPCLPGINFKDQRWLPPLLQGRSIKHQGEDGAMAEGDHCARQGQTKSLSHADQFQGQRGRCSSSAFLAYLFLYCYKISNSYNI